MKAKKDCIFYIKPKKECSALNECICTEKKYCSFYKSKDNYQKRFYGHNRSKFEVVSK